LIVAAAAGFVALKFLVHIHFSIFGVGFYLAVVLAAGLAVLASPARPPQATSPTVLNGG
jgi:hypothetical protein